MPESHLRPTVWDRLTDAKAMPSGLAGDGRVYGERQVCESIRLELTRLLNSRSSCVGWPPEMEELPSSLANFGVADYTGANMLDSSARETLRRGVEDAVRRFEPRLCSVSVTLPDGVDEAHRTIRLRVNARLDVGGVHDAVSFESQLDPRRRRFHVEVAGR